MGDFVTRLTSRKFLLAVGTVAFIVVQAAAGAITTAEAVDAIWKVVAAYVAAEGAADAASRFREVATAVGGSPNSPKARALQGK